MKTWLLRHASMLRVKAKGADSARVAELLRDAALRLEMAARELLTQVTDMVACEKCGYQTAGVYVICPNCNAGDPLIPPAPGK